MRGLKSDQIPEEEGDGDVLVQYHMLGSKKVASSSQGVVEAIF